jgi:hypothetical protein
MSKSLLIVKAREPGVELRIAEETGARVQVEIYKGVQLVGRATIGKKDRLKTAEVLSGKPNGKH